MKRSLLAILVAAVGCGGNPTGPKGGGAVGIAAIDSDYMSTVLSLIDPKTDALAQDDCLDSGAVTPVLTTALSGDVVLASAPQPDNQLVLIDRTNSALVYVTPSTCAVTRQVSVGTGFYSNPHDVVGLSAHKAYVTRFETNATPSGAAGANDHGDDVLIIDPSTGGVTGSIELTPYATTMAGATLEARPDRALLAGDRVFVSLGNQSADFSATGAGRLVVIDPSTDAVTGTVDLPEYKSCSGLDYLASSETLVVGCSGDYNAGADQAAQSAIVLVDVSGAPRVKKAITGAATGGRPLSGSVFAVAGDNLVLTTTAGDFSGTANDTLWALALDSGAATKVGEAAGAFVLGSIVYTADLQHAMVSDSAADKPRVHVYDVSQPAAITELASFEANPKSGLPPRQLARY